MKAGNGVGRRWNGGRPATCHFLCFFFVPFLKSFSKYFGHLCRHLFSLPVFLIQFISTGLSFSFLLRPASVSLKMAAMQIHLRRGVRPGRPHGYWLAFALKHWNERNSLCWLRVDGKRIGFLFLVFLSHSHWAWPSVPTLINEQRFIRPRAVLLI